MLLGAWEEAKSVGNELILSAFSLKVSNIYFLYRK